MCSGFPLAHILFPLLPLHSEIMPYSIANHFNELHPFIECPLPTVVSTATWFSYGLYKWSIMTFKYLKHLRVGKWNYLPCSLKTITLLSSCNICPLMVSLPGSSISLPFLIPFIYQLLNFFSTH